MSAKQGTLKAFLALSSSSESEEESAYTPSPKKSALMVPDLWTRVKSRQQMASAPVQAFDIEKELTVDRAKRTNRASSTRVEGVLLFDPDLWRGRSDELKIATNVLTLE